MSEDKEHSEEESLRCLFDALTHAESRLTEIARTEYRRRRDVHSAIAHIAAPQFSLLTASRRNVEKRKKSRVARTMFVAVVIVGSTLHELFRDESKCFDFTFGAWVVFVAFAIAIGSITTTHFMEQDLRECRKGIDELRYRWIANGGREDRFNELQSHINLECDDVDRLSDQYSRWWIEAQGDLIDRLNGVPSGFGAWRIYGPTSGISRSTSVRYS